jgi:GT2 family glycosyltransferase
LKCDPNVSVVICCYTEERWDDIARAIASVRVQTVAAGELILAVDHAPELAARVRSAYPDAIVVESSGPRGLSGARNSGVDVATGEIVAFLDDDAVAAVDWLEQLCAPYTDDKVDGVGGRVLPQFDGARPAWFPPEFDWVIGCTYTGHPEAAGPIRNMIGANMSFRRRVFEELGGFDDRVGRVAALPAGCEETEFCIRLRQRRTNAVVWYAPEAIVFHRVRPNRTTFRYFRARCRAEGASKNRVSRMVGARDGLESERAYTTRTLPTATWRDVQAGLRGTSPGAWGRAGARVAGVAIAGGGLVEARLRAREPIEAGAAGSADTPFAPVLPVTIDLATGAAPIRDRRADGQPYTRALVLVRDAGTPIATVELALPPDGLSGDDVDRLVREQLGAPVHGREDESASHALFSASSMFGGLPHVTVVVATRDRPEALRRCVDSILASRYPRFDIVVVDNAPASIATQRVVADAYGPGHNVRYVREPTPGLACAHNRALPEITSPIVAFTDDDVVVDPEWLAKLVAGFGVAPDVACVTGMIFPLELETPAQLLIERAIGFNKGMERRLYRVGTPGSDDVLFPYAAGRFGSGANMAFRTDVLRSLAGFDPALGTGTVARGGDDLAAFFDVVASGHALVYEPAAVIYHAHRRDDAALSRQAFGYGAGLTAYLTKTVVDRPGRLVDLLSRLPAGLRHALARDSEKNAKLPDDYPQALVRRELAGMLAGPALYWRSRRATRHMPRPTQHPSGSPLAPAADGPGA